MLAAFYMPGKRKKEAKKEKRCLYSLKTTINPEHSQLPLLPRYRLGDPVDSSRAMPSPNRRVLRLGNTNSISDQNELLSIIFRSVVYAGKPKNEHSCLLRERTTMPFYARFSP